MTQQPASATRYIQATRGDVAFMKVVRWLTDHGVSLLGSRVLTVRGRKTGTPQSVPVNLLPLDGRRFLVAPRGNTQWVRNVRVAGEAQLRVGRRVETVRLVEVPADRPRAGPPRVPEAVGLGGRPLRRGPHHALHRRRARRGRAGNAGFPAGAARPRLPWRRDDAGASLRSFGMRGAGRRGSRRALGACSSSPPTPTPAPARRPRPRRRRPGPRRPPGPRPVPDRRRQPLHDQRRQGGRRAVAGRDSAGHIGLQVTVTNGGSAPCVVEGFPGVSLVTGTQGQQLGAPAKRTSGDTDGDHPRAGRQGQRAAASWRRRRTSRTAA